MAANCLRNKIAIMLQLAGHIFRVGVGTTDQLARQNSNLPPLCTAGTVAGNCIGTN
jgi:hypothetical protein